MQNHICRAEDINIVKVPVLPKCVYQFSTIPVKIPADFLFFVKIDKADCKIYLEIQTTIAKTVLKKVKLCDLIYPITRLNVKQRLLRQYWHKNEESRNRPTQIWLNAFQ